MRRSRAAALLAALAAACTSPQPCPSPLEECEGQCVDVQSDRRHCGGCGRSCAAGDACVAATCGADRAAACPLRAGGAFVTVQACGAAVKLWIENGDFVAAARAGLGTAAAGVPVLGVRTGTDCDGQWTWHVDPASARFETAAPSASCDVCPARIQADVAAYVLAIGSWCPTGATILAVDAR